MTNLMKEKEGFMLGTFSSNCSSGMTVTKSPDRWVNSWDNNLKLGQMLDDAGIDFMLPIARWIGYGGETDFPRRGSGDPLPGRQPCWPRPGT